MHPGKRLVGNHEFFSLLRVATVCCNEKWVFVESSG